MRTGIKIPLALQNIITILQNHWKRTILEKVCDMCQSKHCCRAPVTYCCLQDTAAEPMTRCLKHYVKMKFSMPECVSGKHLIADYDTHM